MTIIHFNELPSQHHEVVQIVCHADLIRGLFAYGEGGIVEKKCHKSNSLSLALNGTMPIDWNLTQYWRSLAMETFRRGREVEQKTEEREKLETATGRHLRKTCMKNP